MKYLTRIAGALAAVVILSISLPAQAQDFTRGVRPAGMGQAYTGIASGTSAIFHNPAGIARAVMYSLEGTFEYTPTGTALNLGIVDSKTNPNISAGVSYTYFLGHGDSSDVNGHDIRLALAVPVLPERISLGIGGRWIIANVGDIQTINQPTIDAGALFRVGDQLHIGLAGRNLIDVCNQPQQCGGVAPMLVEGGLAFGNGTTFNLSADAGLDLTSDPDGVSFNAEAGGEYLIGEVVPVRLGYQYKGFQQRHFVTSGLGWRSSRAGVDTGFRIDPQDPGTFYVSASFSLYF